MTNPADRPGEAGDGGARAMAVRLRRLNGEINRLVHAFAADGGLGPTDVTALALVLDAPEPLTPGILGRHLGLSSGAVTACLDRLERGGHVVRARDETDRRVVRVHYAESSRPATRAFFAPLADAAERARERFSEEELLVVARFLDALNEEMASRPDSAGG
ncbi:MarR family winged helix-turn-helix transcriptional regulator (plasmid) [Streptomyces sp. BI20]|uniref:MarR family winged helix-turn-helix transcriptional regulator n=1 Tax=Streptomyces sp. BI20 TaxID=3403460 RepID=UPI003C766BCC